MTELSFTGQEFEILWAAYDRDRLPYPLQFQPEATDFDDLKRQREAAVESLFGKYSTDLTRALEVLLDPEARVESKGFSGPELARTYRFHGAVHGEEGATLTQDDAGDVILRRCTASEVAKSAMRILPPTQAGTHPPIEVRREEVATDRARHVRPAYELSLTQQLNRIFQRDRLGLGEITVYAGPAVDARPAFGRGFWWMDYEDGRYYVQTGDPIIAKPMDAAVMAAELDRLLALTQRFNREDRDHDEYLRRRAPRGSNL
ncbi:ESX secretion-associated protein EspG [Nocardia sp. NPDC052566]|uniref:ESX secretion-associated protein EspG n=1 Tax=Nocardia sp. NPDC052566 TaxID=3364330 RepID=UPI0037CB24C6